MKINHLFETDSLSMVKMVTQGIRNVKLDPKEVDVKYKKHGMARKKECFNNAFKAMTGNKSERFVLGYVFFHGIPIEHAWIKEGEEYFDVTLDPKNQDSYISVLELEFDTIMEYVDAHHSAPSLFDLNRHWHK